MRDCYEFVTLWHTGPWYEQSAAYNQVPLIYGQRPKHRQHSEVWLIIVRLLLLLYLNTPSDTKSIMEFILGPSSYMLWLNKWQAKLEEKMLDNLDLPAGDPLRLVTLEQLMRTGGYRGTQRQAALHQRILWQSQNAALTTFLALPQIGTPLRPYTKIMQEPQEPFIKFVDRR